MTTPNAWCSSSGCTLADARLRVERVGERLQPVAVGEEGLLAAADALVEQREDHVARRAAALDDLQELAERDQLLELLLERGRR